MATSARFPSRLADLAGPLARQRLLSSFRPTALPLVRVLVHIQLQGRPPMSSAHCPPGVPYVRMSAYRRFASVEGSGFRALIGGVGPSSPPPQRCINAKPSEHAVPNGGIWLPAVRAPCMSARHSAAAANRPRGAPSAPYLGGLRYSEVLVSRGTYCGWTVFRKQTCPTFFTTNC